MFIELDKITTLGLQNTNMLGVQVLKKLWRTYYQDNTEEYIYNIVKDNLYDDNYKNVDEQLKSLIGVYPITVSNPEWTEEFVLLFREWVERIDNINYHMRIEDEKYFLKQQETTTIQNEQGLCIDYSTRQKWLLDTNAIVNKLRHDADFIQGTVKQEKNNTKILKYMKKEISKSLNKLTDADFEQMEWYKFYNIHKNSNEQLYLVITNSITSIMGMSTYAPINSRTENRVWKSCQSHGSYSESYAKGTWATASDKGSLIVYITDGQHVSFYDLEDQPFNHQQMLARYMVRLLTKETLVECEHCSNKIWIHTEQEKCKHCGEVNKNTNSRFLMLDRAYPNDRYTQDVLPILEKLCSNNNLTLCMANHYNSSQNHDYYRINDTYDQVTCAYNAHKINVVNKIIENPHCTTCGEFINRACRNCYEDCVKTCPNPDNEHHCSSCGEYEIDYCNGRDCEDCGYSPCNNRDDDEVTIYTHYDDQNGNCDANNASFYDGITYAYAYEITYKGEKNNEANA